MPLRCPAICIAGSVDAPSLAEVTPRTLPPMPLKTTCNPAVPLNEGVSLRPWLTQNLTMTGPEDLKSVKTEDQSSSGSQSSVDTTPEPSNSGKPNAN